MNRKQNTVDKETEGLESGEYAVKRSRRSGVIAAIICLLLAVIVWIVVMHADDTAYVPLYVADDSSELNYVLSDDSIEVKGTILALKKADRVEVILPDEIAEDIANDTTKTRTYVLTVEDLIFPEGVALAQVLELTLTVEKQ